MITDAAETVYLSGKDQDVITVTFGNDKMGSLLIVKKDAVTGTPISDVEFFVTDSDGSVIGTANGKYVTDSAGTIRIDGLTPGMTVIAKEVRAKDGYILDDTPQSIKIKRNSVMTLEFRNQPKGGVLVKKVDAVTNAPISDVEFLVTDSDGNLIGNANGKFVTDSAGTFTITDIAPGTTLVIKETRAKVGYILDDTPQTVKVKSNEVVTVEFRNQPKGNLIIVKQDSVTKEPLEGVQFKIVYADGSYVDAEGGTLSSTGLYWTDKEGKITLSGISGTVVVTEVETIPGYTIDENTRTQTVVINPNDTQTLHFYNDPVGGVEIIKVNEDNHSERIPNTTFEIRKVDDALVDTVTTDKNGRVFVALEDGSYYAKEVTSNKSFRLDDTPHYFEIKDGKRVTLQVTNKKLSGIVIHKIDSATGEGIYGVKFVLYDANKKPIGEYTSDDEGYIYIDEIPGGLSGRFYLRELEAAPGYTLDKQYKTVYVSPGKTVEIEWENTAVTGQIQIYKYAAEYNEVTGTAAGTPLKGAVYEIVNVRSGKVVDYITTDARGVAASKPLPLTRYQIREVTAPAYWQLDPKGDARSDPAGYGGDACINQGYADGWLNLPAMAAPDSRLCRYAIYESGFTAFDIALYSSQLYPDGEALSSQDNAFHAAVSFGLCEDTCAGTDIITRGEAADLLYALLTGEFTVAPPPILETIPLNNKEGVHLNSYLLELQKIPEPIRQAFAERGWQYTIDYEYLARLSEERNMSCIGATNYGSRQITVSSAGATAHEFGHFLDELMGFPSQTEGFYQEESGTAAALLRPYALTNEREYFADCFVYWLTYRDNSKKMAALCSAAPKTYAYLLALESQNWQPAA